MELFDRISVHAKLWVLGGSLIFIAVCLWAGGFGYTRRVAERAARMSATLQEVARARDLPLSTVLRLVGANTTGRSLGLFGDPGVNVLTLNIALDTYQAQH